MSLHSDPPFYTGTSNIVLPVPNKAAFPEAFRSGSRLTYYASLFNSLEVNASFYKLPLAKTVARWADETGSDFRFTFKLHRDITHDMASAPDPELVRRFMQTINAAERKAGSLLVQFPAGRTDNPAFLERLLGQIRHSSTAWDICVEFRHTSWYRDAVYKLLQRYEAGLVLHDMPKSAPALEHFWTDFVYLRFHGPRGDYKGGYELEALEQQAEKIKAMLADGKRVYTYFNNTIGTAVFDALALQELVTGKVIELPETDS